MPYEEFRDSRCGDHRGSDRLLEITLDDLIGHVHNLGNRQIETAGERGSFSVFVKGQSFGFRLPSGRVRNESFAWMEQSLSLFNQSNSLRIEDYQMGGAQTHNASYVLGLIVHHISALEEDQAKMVDSNLVYPTLTSDELANLSLVEATERDALIQARMGQGRFRRQVLELRACCAVTGIEDSRLLRASHIKPWKDCTNDERLDPHNGLLLIPNFDHLFDAGLISFQADGGIIISTELTAKDQMLLGATPDLRIGELDARTNHFMGFHRRFVFLG